jgi:hypothetical protein
MRNVPNSSSNTSSLERWHGKLLTDSQATVSLWYRVSKLVSPSTFSHQSYAAATNQFADLNGGMVQTCTKHAHIPLLEGNCKRVTSEVTIDRCASLSQDFISFLSSSQASTLVLYDCLVVECAMHLSSSESFDTRSDACRSWSFTSHYSFLKHRPTDYQTKSPINRKIDRLCAQSTTCWYDRAKIEETSDAMCNESMTSSERNLQLNDS